MAATSAPSERSHGGTLFLDEVGKLSIPIQKKILTVIDDGLVRRVGGQRDIPVRVRHIFAANESLETLVHEGKLLPE
jgi:transcriptional regulator with AAA-type ATPase domain